MNELAGYDKLCDQLPTSRQLHGFARFACSQSLINGKVNVVRPKRAMLVHFPNRESIEVTDNGLMEIHKRTVMRVGRVAHCAWSLRIITTNDYYSPESIDAQTNSDVFQLGVREFFFFEWSRTHVTRSSKLLVQTPAADAPDIADYIDRFTLTDDAAAVLGFENDLRLVTSLDLALLRRDISG